MTPLHLGPLHPVEQVLTLILAFGPFVVLGVVVWFRRRSDAAADSAADSVADSAAGSDAGASGEAGPGVVPVLDGDPQRDR